MKLGAILRTLRRRADMSQRELATRAGIAQSHLARLETGANDNPRLRTLERLVGAASARLAVVDLDGTEPEPMATDVQLDAAGRRFPPHLDTRPATRWRGIFRTDLISFRRNRRARDERRRDLAGQRRWDLFTEFRLLGPGDLAVLAVLRSDAAQFDLVGRRAPVLPAPDDAEALRYLRDPGLLHFVADDGGHIPGHLVAHLQRRHDRPPALVVTELGLRSDHRADFTGPHLAAAARDEASRLGAGDIWALADHPVVAAHLRHLGFRAAPRGVRLMVA